MSYASKFGRAKVSAKSPAAFAICDRCSLGYNLVDLQWQYDWRGTSLQNLQLRVCKRCLDTPQSQLRAITLPADPVPVWQPRPENFDAAEIDYRTTVPGTIDPLTGIPIPNSTQIITQDSQNRVTQPYGAPQGLDQNAVMPYSGVVQKAFGVVLPVLSIISNGDATVYVTCSQPHGLINNDQISVQGLMARNACGFFSVTMFTATMFTYMTVSNTPAGSLLTPTTRLITVLVGLPRGFDTISPVGP
jgi:hypothetical protein